MAQLAVDAQGDGPADRERTRKWFCRRRPHGDVVTLAADTQGDGPVVWGRGRGEMASPSADARGDSPVNADVQGDGSAGRARVRGNSAAAGVCGPVGRGCAGPSAANAWRETAPPAADTRGAYFSIILLAMVHFLTMFNGGFQERIFLPASM